MPSVVYSGVMKMNFTGQESRNMTFAERIQKTADRMSDSGGSRWHRELGPVAHSIRRGSLYEGGPVCLAAYDETGKYLGSVIEADADRMKDHPNSRPTR